MKMTSPTNILCTASIAALLLAGCENLPGTREEQATVIGGAAGAAVGAATTDDLWGVLLGAAAGAAGGYLIGANTDWFERDADVRQDQAQAAVEEARRNPAQADDVFNAETADLNGNGFVTTDELLAMEEAGLSDDEILSRLEATDQVFELSEQQRQEFLAAGLSPTVVDGLEQINRSERDAILSDPQVIGSTG